MAIIISEDVSVGINAAGLVEITHVQIHDDGIDMGGKLMFEVPATSWVTAELSKAGQVWGYNAKDHSAGADNLRVFIGGSDMQPFVHLHNQRDPEAPEGRIYALGMSVDTAKALSEKLATL